MRCVGAPQTPSGYESIRRAVRTLAKRGLVTELRGFPRRYGTAARRELETRLELHMLMYQTVMGRAEIVRQLGYMPDVVEWLRMGKADNYAMSNPSDLSVGLSASAPNPTLNSDISVGTIEKVGTP